MEILSLLVSILIGLFLFVTLLFRFFPWIKHDLHLIRKSVRILRLVTSWVNNKMTIVDLFEKSAKKYPDKAFLLFGNERYTYRESQANCNKMANLILTLQKKKRDIVAIYMYNDPGLIWAYLGIASVAIETAFFNYNLRSKSLLHCFDVSDPRIVIVGKEPELVNAIVEILPQLSERGVEVYSWQLQEKLPAGIKSLLDLFENSPATTIDKKTYRDSVNVNGPICYIYTSGTTGMPKAAVLSHLKTLKGGTTMELIDITPDDVIYSALPLYHSGALTLALSNAISKGATFATRPKFSASNFFDDCRKFDATIVQYIGELCRYLLVQPKSPKDRAHRVRAAYGNGLRMDIWKEFQDRFGIGIIAEYFGATEGNLFFLNCHNQVGAVGRASPLTKLFYPTYFLKCDHVTADPIRNERGFCTEVPPGEPGLSVCQIKQRYEYEGYKGNSELTEKKIIRDVFVRGDQYFNTGDLLVYDKDYFLYFYDRIGDTFRWKGENVSTTEVSNVITGLKWIEDANIYGVLIPGSDGRAGMASLKLMSGASLSVTSLKELYQQCDSLLPGYAKPRFVRVQQEFDMTSTMKQRKLEAVKEGFDPDKVGSDPLYCIDFDRNTYIPIDRNVYNDIINGKIRL